MCITNQMDFHLPDCPMWKKDFAPGTLERKITTNNICLPLFGEDYPINSGSCFFDLYPDQLLFEWLSFGYPLLPQKKRTWNLKITPKWVQGNSSTQSTSIVFASHLCGSGEVLHPRNLTWNPKMKVWKMFVLFTRVILRFMLVFQGVFQ